MSEIGSWLSYDEQNASADLVLGNANAVSQEIAGN